MQLNICFAAGPQAGSLPELFDEAEIRLDERPAVGFVLLYDVALEGLTPVGVEGGGRGGED